MNGDVRVVNLASDGTEGYDGYATVNGIELRGSDGKNLVCPGETYFDPTFQLCTTYPFDSDLSMVYTSMQEVTGSDDESYYELQFQNFG